MDTQQNPTYGMKECSCTEAFSEMRPSQDRPPERKQETKPLLAVSAPAKLPALLFVDADDAA
ncbi:hypothetical protein [Stutzerimonas stutzeri]|uniref:hypothetical protein n=1 Tax=Stutzerimonas stutzeri TaxID=316 RepID=UPI001C2E9A47|nr:hypothetical protein [Stutzerimonas stutzeri]